MKFLLEKGATPFGCMTWAREPPIVEMLSSNGCDERGDTQKLDLKVEGRRFREVTGACVCLCACVW